MGWKFILHAGTNLDLYGKGNERILVDTTTMGLVLYSTPKVLLTSGVVETKGKGGLNAHRCRC